MAVTPATALSVRAVPVRTTLPLVGGLDAALVSSIAILAGIVRWPNLLLSPQFSAGGTGILMALDIADGRAFYLREVSPYIGAPYIWLLALVYRVFGPSIEATMLLTWAIGTLTIVPAYFLGREIGGRVVGGITALLLATSAAHTVITSHVPISHSLTPFVSTTALWLIARAVRRAEGDLARGGRLLALAGFLAGVALQTHPTIAPLLAGAALGAVLMHRRWLRTRWPAVALALAVLGYGSLLVYHVTSGFEIVADIREKQDRYRDVGHVGNETPFAQLYSENLSSLLLSAARLESGVIDDRNGTADYLTDPWVVAPFGVAVAGLAVAVRRRALWLAVALIVAVVVPPAFNGKYRPILDGRFLMPLLPVFFVLAGLAVAGMARVIRRASDGRTGGAASRLARRGGLCALVVGTVLLAGHSLTLLGAFYENSIEDGNSNSGYLHALADIQGARRGDEAVMLDPQLAQVKADGGGKASTSLSWLLAVSRIPSEALPEAVDAAQLAGHLAILHRTTAARLDDTFALDALDGKRLTGKDRPSFRAYRIRVAEARQP